MHIYCVKLNNIKLLFLLVLVVILLSINFGSNVAASVYFNSSLREIPIYFVNTAEKKVAISFDAAWGADSTEKIMEICKEYNVNATFFLTGIWVEKYPDMVKKIFDNGFEIGTHSNTHPDMTKLSISQIKLELETCCNMITKITNKKVKLFKPPYGAYSDNVINTAKDKD